jgi:hypothetical protein
VSVSTRFRPETKEAFSLYAGNLAACLDIPLQSSQELLARLYGYANLHELLAVLKTPAPPGPFQAEDPERDAARCARFAELLPAQLQTNLTPEQRAIAPTVPARLGLFLPCDKHPAVAAAFFSAALTERREGLEFYAGRSAERLRKRLVLLRKLMEAQIVQSMRLFHERFGRYPSKYSGVVWTRDAAGDWSVVPGESWGSINTALQDTGEALQASSASTLVQLRAAHGLMGPRQALTEALILQWIQNFQDMEGRYPGVDDEIVWGRHPDGRYQAVAHLNWRQINDALVYRLCGLPEGPGITLEDFMLTHGLHESHPSSTE